MGIIRIIECCRSGSKMERSESEFRCTDKDSMLVHYAVACLCSTFEEIQNLYDIYVASGIMAEPAFFSWLCKAFRINYASGDYVTIVADHGRICLRGEDTEDIDMMSIHAF